MKRVVLLVTAMLALSTASAHAGLESSRWRSTYRDYQGTFVVNAPINFQGNIAYYYPSGGQGTLSNINYFPSPSGGTTIKGNWSSAGVGGWFSFDVTPDRSRFNGTWGYSGQAASGTWSGQQEAPAPAPVPVPFPGSAPAPAPAPGPIYYP
jgi:hypothetical protein